MQNIFKKKIETVRKVAGTILDFFLPKSHEAKLLEKIEPSDFIRLASRNVVSDKDISAIFDYKNPLVRELIRQIKFKGNKKLADLASKLLYDHILSELGELSLFENFKKPILIPVPITDSRKKERGFNQCELICERLSEMDGGNNFEYDKKIITKWKNTESQTKMNRSQRLVNILGSFRVENAKSVRNRNFIILDDVYTTGATIREIKKVLEKTGARKVIGMTLAH